MSVLVGITKDDQIATVTLDRPSLHNAFNETMIAQLTAAFTVLCDDDSVRVVLLRSTGKSFCAGADVNWMKRMVDYTYEQNVADAGLLARMLRAVRECSKPVIARVHGACIGGGVGLVAACDLAVAIESAVFSLSEVRLGIVPAVISPFVMEKVGPGVARRFALTAERFDAQQAERIGLVSQAVASVEEMDEWIVEKCEQLKANGPQALARCKRILTEVANTMWDETQEKTVRCIAEIRVSPEGQEGLKAFLEKRKPDWSLQE